MLMYCVMLHGFVALLAFLQDIGMASVFDKPMVCLHS